ncbi:MAG: M28 family peptidase [Planctomycetes bacterium]|nr:M28 family peptidase [Planctomycetota bacterium]
MTTMATRLAFVTGLPSAESRSAWSRFLGGTFAAVALLASVVCPACAQQPLIECMVDQCDEIQYQLYLQTIEDMGLGLYGGSLYDQGYRGRDTYWGIDMPGNEEARLYLVNQLTSFGLNVVVQGDFTNVVAELPGQVTPERIFIVGAHYDSTEAVPAPGGDDNASGTAGVLEAARIMSQYRFKSTIRFIAFNAEEDGLLGSLDYVLAEVFEHDENVVGMIALDMIVRPYNDDDPEAPIDLDLDCQYGVGDLAWVLDFIDAATAYVPDLAIDPETPFTAELGGSDHLSFTWFGYPAFMCIENTEEELFSDANPYYHTSDDFSRGPAGAQFDYVFATNVVRATVATLAEAAEIMPEAIAATAATDVSWVYQNTLVGTKGRHRAVMTIHVTDDPNGNAHYAVAVTVDPTSTGSVTLQSTANPLVWYVLGGTHDVAPVGNVKLNVTITGTDHGGSGKASAALTVRLLGDINVDGGVEPSDMSLLINDLNGMPLPAGYESRQFDLDANGGAEPGDLSLLINILNGLPVS